MGMICNSFSINLCFANGKTISMNSGVDNEGPVCFSDRMIQESDVESFESIRSMIEDKILIFGCNLLSGGDYEDDDDFEDDDGYEMEWEDYWYSVSEYDFSDLCGVILMTHDEEEHRIDYIILHVNPSFKSLSGSKEQSFVKDDSGRGDFVPDIESCFRELIKDLPIAKTSSSKSKSAKSTTKSDSTKTKQGSSSSGRNSNADENFQDENFEYILRKTEYDFDLGEEVESPRYEITSYIGTSSSVDVPETIGGIKVEKFSLGERRDILKISIPDSVEYDDGQLLKCEGLYDDLGNLIINGRLLRMKNITPILRIPDRVHTIAKSVIYHNYQQDDIIEELILPEGLKRIEREAFKNCESLRTIQFPKSLEEIGYETFSDCESLTEIVLPEGTKKIGSYAFQSCKSLRVIRVPSTCEICEQAFENCSAVGEGPTIVNGIFFDADPYESVIIVPPEVESISAYAIGQPGDILDSVTITDNIKYISEYAFVCTGIQWFRVVDHLTGKPLFETNKFKSSYSSYTTLDSSPRFKKVCDLICAGDYSALSEFGKVFSEEDSEKALKGKTTAKKSSKTSAKTTTAAKTASSKNASIATKKKSAAPMSFNVSQFKGIHKVTKAPERVWVGNMWSIEVPVGFSYTADPEKASDVLGLLRFQLNIQNSKDCNFDVPFTSVFNVVVDEGLDFADLNCDDISDETFIQSLDALSDDYQIHKCSRDLVVLYKVSTESNEYSSCEFQVVTRGNNAIFSGRFACKEGTIDERKKNILHWLDTIDVLTQDEKISFTDYSGKSEIKIPTEYGEEMAPIDPGIRISVPQGFHAETNQDVIGNGLKLVIVPDNFSPSDYLLDAPVLLLVQSSVMKNTPTRADLMNDYFIQMCNQGKFKDVYAASVYKNSEKAFTITQIYSGGGIPKSSSVSMLFANNKVYTVFVIISYTEESFDRNIGLWDVEHLANAWLARIQVDVETVPNYSTPSSSSSVKTNLSAKDVSTSPQAGAEDPIAKYEARADSWIQKYREYIDHDPEIDFDGSLFVFSGFGVLGKDDPTVLDVIEKGGQYRSKVSGLTNYLVVDPGFAGDSQIVAVIEQLQKGKNIKVILLEDLEEALKNKTTTKKSSTTSAKTTAAKTSSSKSTSTKSTTKSKHGSSSAGKNSTETGKSNELYDIDDTTGTLTQYKGKGTDIVLPTGIKIIGQSVFEYGEITSVVIPEGVEVIDDRAFSECKNLKSVKLPNTIKKIGVDAFSLCEQLTSIEIPNGVETIGDSAFFQCENLKSITLPNTFNKIGRCTFDSCEQLTSIVIPEGVETIDDNAFSSCKNLISVTLPNTIKTIGAFAFELCEQLTGIVIPEGVETIGDYAFSECKELKDIYVPDSVHVIGKRAFDTENDDTIVHTVRGSRADTVAQGYCKVDYRYPSSSTASTVSSKATYTPASSPVYNSTENSKSNELCDIDDTGRLTRYRGREKDIVLPNGIKIIGKRAFERRKTTSIVIPEGVETIEAYAFSNCQNLNSVTLPRTIKIIGDYAFNWCEQLTSIVIPEGVETIDSNAFYFCTCLKSVTLPNTIKKIGDHAFCNCKQLTSIVIPEGVETIDEFAFAGCDNLKTVTLPNTIKKIGDNAFAACEQLTQIFIPEGCEEIGNYIIYNCEKMKEIYIPGSVQKIGSLDFTFANDDITVHTVRGSTADIETQKHFKVDYRYPSSSTASTASSKTTYTPASSYRANVTIRDSANYSTSTRRPGNSIASNSTSGTPASSSRTNATSNNSNNTGSGGCYVATAVYGSYDCPEVWTLRRYRDYTLAETWYGRAFIKVYYAISPTLVKWFGHTEWFKTMWRGKLDRMVSNLKKQGVESSPYQDRKW